MFNNLLKQEKNSIFSFYRGYPITVIGMIPYAGLSFSSFERLKIFIINSATLSPYLCTITHPKSQTENATNTNTSFDNDHKYYELNVGGKLISGAMTGIIAQTVTYPVDVVRRHMQLATMVTDAAIRQLVYFKKIYLFSSFSNFLKEYIFSTGFIKIIF